MMQTRKRRADQTGPRKRWQAVEVLGEKQYQLLSWMKKGDKLVKGKTDLMPVIKRDEGNVKKGWQTDGRCQAEVKEKQLSPIRIWHGRAAKVPR
jgi:hypothetical protein